MTSRLARRAAMLLCSAAATMCATLGSVPAFADEPPHPPKSEEEPATKPSSFGAEAPAPLPEVAPGDFEGLLRNCDIERARAADAVKMCKKDEANIPFLTGAYLALWAILLVFFAIVAMRQKRMRAEMEMLRERLARLGEESS